MVDAGTPVSVAAGSDLEEEGAVHSVFFRSVDTGQVAGTAAAASAASSSFRGHALITTTLLSCNLSLSTVQHEMNDLTTSTTARRVWKNRK